MPINPNIAMGFQAPQIESPMNMMAQMMQMKSAQEGGQLNALKLQQAQREVEQQNMLGQAYQSAFDPQTGKVDYSKLTSQLAGAGAGAQIPGILKGQRELESADVEAKTKKVKLLTDTLSTVPEMYKMASTPDDLLAVHQYVHSDPVLGPWLKSIGATPEKGLATLQAASQTPEGLAQYKNQAMSSVSQILESAKPLVVAPSASVFAGGKFKQAPAAPAAAPTPSTLAKLQTEKAALPPGDPRHAAYDAAIAKESQFAPNAEPLADFQAFMALPSDKQAEFLKFKKAGATNVSATATTSPTGKSLSAPVGQRVETSLVKAEGATSIMETANSVRDALNAGNVIAGPLAGARTKFAQVLELAGAGDKEKLINTRTAIQGLAGLTLESRAELKGQGQITDSETKLLEKARSGNLDEMTIPELQQIVNISQRFANKLWSNHQSLLGKMKDDPAAKDSIRYYEPSAPMAVPVLEGKTPAVQRKEEKRPSLGSIFGGVAPTGGVPQGRK